MPLCRYGDPLCPCQDGDLCHYEGPGAWEPPPPAAKTRSQLMREAGFTRRKTGKTAGGLMRDPEEDDPC